MFGWFGTKCPVPEADRRWIEYRMAWLVEHLGAERMRKSRVVLPTEEFFPDSYDGSAKAARGLLARICGYMDVDPGQIDLQLYSERRPEVAFGVYVHDPDGGTAGLYDAHGGKTTVWLEASNLEDPESVVATLAHELGHFHLLGKGHVEEATEDHEPLTDLVPVYFGLGIFSANATLRSVSWRAGNWEGWRASRQGYLTASLLGYALAWFAWYREESYPVWSRYLRPDARDPFRKGLHYLEKRGYPDEIEVGDYPGYPPGAFRRPKSEPEPDDEGGDEAGQALPDDSAEQGGSVTLGVVLTSRGDLEGAIREYTASLQQDPEDGEVYQLRGMAYWRLGDHAKAVADGQQAIRLDPEELDGYRLRGLGYFGLDDYDRAMADFHHVLEEQPKDAGMHYWIGRALAVQGGFQEALRHYNHAICFAPTYVELYTARAEAYEKLGDLAKAEADRQEARWRDRLSEGAEPGGGA